MNGILFKGEKIIIPASLRHCMLEKIHTGHMGIDKCKQRARDIMFWPGMSRCIETMVKKCSTCQEHLPANTKEPMIPHRIPDRLWQVVGTDIFSWQGQNYINTVDYYSRFFELDRLTSTTSSSIIHKLKAAFARHGIPEVVVSDNGPQYVSKEFESFSQSWEFKHTTANPHYPQSNGLAERTKNSKITHGQSQSGWTRSLSQYPGIPQHTSRQLQVPCTATDESQAQISLTEHQQTAATGDRQLQRWTGKTTTETTASKAVLRHIIQAATYTAQWRVRESPGTGSLEACSHHKAS